MVNLKPQDLRGLESVTPVLEKIEAGAIGIGVPYLLPTPRVRALRSGSFSPVADYIRSSLVGITTADLENFRLQLISEKKASNALVLLGFARLTFLERFGLPIVIAATVLVGITLTSGIGYTNTAVIAAKLSLPVFAVCLILVSRARDGFRRYSFIRLIQHEISRRSGHFGDGSPAIPLTACRTPN
jgi:hypothetical protein